MTTQHGHILVVDDNRMNRIKLSTGLEQQGHSVTLAEHGKQALEMMRAPRYAGFDVVLLDIMMPEMDGYQVLEQLKNDSALRDIPVIVISALDEIDSIVRCIEMGAEDYLTKPFDPVLLKARLSASLEKKKLRDLERAYLQQEVMLRQSEKLATLGKLSAGMAHELNNPIAAVQRGAGHLRTAIAQAQQALLKLGESSLTKAQLDALLAYDQLAQERAAAPTDLDALMRCECEDEIKIWLEARGIENAWEFTPALVNLGYDNNALAALAENFTAAQIPAVIAWLSNAYLIYSLLAELGHGSGRMAEIIKALKAYTYMDQAPVQSVDVHEGLDNTLVMLRNKLKMGIDVHRQYAENLPRLQAYGSELNQVWTNIIDNAVDAMQGRGELTLRTRQEEQWVVVEIEDNGPGIPEAVQAKIFDPFFTTKAPGKGTGLGLNISHNIIVQKHKGKIAVHSQPGKTCFEIRLPIDISPAEMEIPRK
jgi:signal transduction histidine kinase